MYSHPLFFVFIVVLVGLILSHFSRPLILLVIKKIANLFPEDIKSILLGQSQLAYSLFILWL